jgi:hypothetical protein
MYKSLGTNQIPAKMSQAGSKTYIPVIILSGIQKNRHSYGRNLLLYLFTQLTKILYNNLLSRLTPYADKIIGDHYCGFQHNESTTDQILCICQTLEKKWENNETVHQLFTGFKKAYDCGDTNCTTFSLDLVYP